MKQNTEDSLISETLDAVLDCVEYDGNEIVDIDEVGIKASLVAFVHRLRSGETSVEDSLIQKLKDRASQHTLNIEPSEITCLATEQEKAIDKAIYLERMIQVMDE